MIQFRETIYIIAGAIAAGILLVIIWFGVI